MALKNPPSCEPPAPPTSTPEPIPEKDPFLDGIPFPETIQRARSAGSTNIASTPTDGNEYYEVPDN